MSKKYQNVNYPQIGDNTDSIVYYLLLDELNAVDPKAYFQTSGEAVAKAEKLDKDVWKLAGQTRKLLNNLKKARAASKYLEVTHEEMNGVRTLICRRKDPRGKKPKPNPNK